MRFLAFAVAALCHPLVAAWPELAAAQDGRDFVFTDEEGHLVLRFAGVGPGGLDASQIEEIVNVQLSTMVHDRLRADAEFEAEPIDLPWAEPMEARIADHVRDTGPAATSAIHIECRSASCRLLLEHSNGWSVSDHQSMMGEVQHALEAFLDLSPTSFEPVFLLAAHYQEPGVPYIKAFLRRQPSSGSGRPY